LKIRKFYGKLLENITIESAGAEGNCIARWEGKVVFVKNAVPGDVCDLKVIGKKKKFLLGEIVKLHASGPGRIEPFCEHFGSCGGCKWQQMEYADQLAFKTQQVKDAFDRIGKVEYDEVPLALGSANTKRYRNKMEYTYSHSRWLTREQLAETEFIEESGLGFHVPKRYDKIVHIEKCHLQDDYANQIRNWCYAYAKEQDISFYDARKQEGMLRNLMLRNTKDGAWMVLQTFRYNQPEVIEPMMEGLRKNFPNIKSLLFSVNEKVNDSLYDLNIELHNGEPYLTEVLHDLTFKIRPKSFFQTNPKQAELLYSTALQFADLSGDENVYDLYCGTGTISLFLAKACKQVVGIESVPQAIEDASENAEVNSIGNCTFVVGDMKDELNDAFTDKHGKPNVIVTDPPRAGMHGDVVQQILKLAPEKVVYVSCNPATQARDLDLMREGYEVAKIQPVDMFPHTHHVENVVLLRRKD